MGTQTQVHKVQFVCLIDCTGVNSTCAVHYRTRICERFLVREQAYITWTVRDDYICIYIYIYIYMYTYIYIHIHTHTHTHTQTHTHTHKHIHLCGRHDSLKFQLHHQNIAFSLTNQLKNLDKHDPFVLLDRTMQISNKKH